MEGWWGAGQARDAPVVGARFGPELHGPLDIPREVADLINQRLSQTELRMDAALRSDDQSLKNRVALEAVGAGAADALALLAASYGDREYVRADLPLSTRFAVAEVRALRSRPRCRRA